MGRAWSFNVHLPPRESSPAANNPVGAGSPYLGHIDFCLAVELLCVVEQMSTSWLAVYLNIVLFS